MMWVKLKLCTRVPMLCAARYRRLVLVGVIVAMALVVLLRLPVSQVPTGRGESEEKRSAVRLRKGFFQQEAYFMELGRRHNRRHDAAIAAFQETRQRLLERSCKHRQSLDSLTRFERKLLFDQILVNDRYRFLYCFTPKVACSNWKKVLMAMDDKALRPENITKVNHARDVKHLHNYSAEEIEHRLKTYYKFMFVREPMARLASAFLNKFREIPSYMKKYGVPIVKRYRPDAPENPKGDDVTWNEFVQYLVDTPVHRYNQHWMPYNMLCQPCAIDYNFIGAYENLESEANYVIRKVHAGGRVAFPPRQRYYKPLKLEKLQNMLKETTPRNLKKLIKLYEDDFDLFGYHPPKQADQIKD